MIEIPELAANGEAMTAQDGEAIIGAAKIPMTGAQGAAAAIGATNYRGQPLKTAQYLTEGGCLAEAVAAHRAARGEASAEGASLTQKSAPAENCNKPRSPRSEDCRQRSTLPKFQAIP
jgi:hypothetical protein